MEKLVNGTCCDYTFDGKGIVKCDGKVVFVDNILNGETAKIEITHEGKNKTIGKIAKLLSASEERQTPFCKIFNKCGGCSLQHMSYKEQLRFKTDHVQSCMNKIAKLDVGVMPCIGMSEPLNYRNKSQVPFSKNYDGPYYGFFRSDSHVVVKMDSCPIQANEANEILKYILYLFKEYKVSIYNENKRFGFIRHVLIKKGFRTGEVMVVFVTNGTKFDNSKLIVERLTKKFTYIKSIIQNVNSKDTNVVLGDKEIVLYGNSYIEDYLLGIKFKISAKSFYQVNPVQTEVLYSTAIEMAKLNKSDIVLDAYCGIGTISLVLADKVKKVVGVEIVKEAIEDAKENASNNNIMNADFVLDDASNYMDDLNEEKNKFSVVFIDPPRKGCDKKFIDSLISLSPKKIIYISCNPSTLARDLEILSSHYAIETVQPVDMFPHTYHVETVVSMVKK